MSSFTTKSRRAPIKQPCHSMEAELLARGFQCPQRLADDTRRYRGADADDKKIKRYQYKLGSIAVMTETKDVPWWTVQYYVGHRIEWYVYFDLSVPTKSVLLFIDSLRGAL